MIIDFTGPVGTAIKNGIGYTIKSTSKKWKLVNNTGEVNFEIVISKKNFSSYVELKNYLVGEGYQVL